MVTAGVRPDRVLSLPLFCNEDFHLDSWVARKTKLGRGQPLAGGKMAIDSGGFQIPLVVQNKLAENTLLVLSALSKASKRPLPQAALFRTLLLDEEKREKPHWVLLLAVLPVKVLAEEESRRKPAPPAEGLPLLVALLAMRVLLLEWSRWKPSIALL